MINIKHLSNQLYKSKDYRNISNKQVYISYQKKHLQLIKNIASSSKYNQNHIPSSEVKAQWRNRFDVLATLSGTDVFLYMT